MSTTNQSTITRATIWEDAGASLMARIVGLDGTNITQASLTSISRKVFDVNSATPDTAVSTATVTVADTVFDTLQTDSRWSVDSTGYNFLDPLAATIFTTGDHLYRVEYLFTPVTGAVYFVVFELYARAVRTS